MAFHEESERNRRFLSEGAKMVQVVDFHSDVQTEFKKDIFEKIIFRGNAGRIPIYMVVITGGYRSGKSFLLNAMLNYLQYREERHSDKDWENSSAPIVNGEWGRSQDSVTKGIWMWDVPLIYEINGDKIALILVDVQGIEDPKYADETVDRLVLYTSMELANVLILNSSKGGSSQTTGKMETAITFSGLFREKVDIICDALIVMIRDFQDDEEGGGEREDLLETMGPQMTVLEAFKRATCFVSPHPGNTLAFASVESTLNLAEIKELDFKISLKHLFFYLLFTIPYDADISEWLNGKQTIEKFKELSDRLADPGDTKLLRMGAQDKITKKIVDRASKEGRELYRRGLVKLSEKEKKIADFGALDDEMNSIIKDIVECFKKKTLRYEASKGYQDCVRKLTTPSTLPKDRLCLGIIKRLAEHKELDIKSDSIIVADFDNDLRKCIGSESVKKLDIAKRLEMINNSKPSKWREYIQKAENVVQFAMLVTLLTMLYVMIMSNC